MDGKVSTVISLINLVCIMLYTVDEFSTHLCTCNWKTFLLFPSWGHDERSVERMLQVVDAHGLWQPSIKLAGSQMGRFCWKLIYWHFDPHSTCLHSSRGLDQAWHGKCCIAASVEDRFWSVFRHLCCIMFHLRFWIAPLIKKHRTFVIVPFIDAFPSEKNWFPARLC